MSGKIVMTSEELANDCLHIRSDVWQSADHFVWSVWHGLGKFEDSEWSECGVGSTPEDCYEQIRVVTIAAARDAGIVVPPVPNEIRVLREHFDA